MYVLVYLWSFKFSLNHLYSVPYFMVCISFVYTCAHSLSMVHDSEQNSCPDKGGVMAAFRGRGLQVYEWSRCSASELRAYRIAGGTKCLMETDPANAIIKPSTPGQQFDLTYQCKAMFGDHAIVCPRLNSVSSSCLYNVYTHVYA